MSVTRYAIVRNARTRREAEAYLPSNYRIIHEEVEDFVGPRAGKPVFVIAGKDASGWTLDGYVIPRYGSGLIWADEIDLSHPIMKRVHAKQADLSAVLIDGALPHPERERVEILLAFAREMLGDGSTYGPGVPVGSLALKLGELQIEMDRVDDDFEHYAEIEDEVIAVINEMLPPGWVCGVGINEIPGDVIITRDVPEDAFT